MPVLFIVSMAAGGLAGSWLDLQGRVERYGRRKGKSRLLPTLPAEALMVVGYWVFDGMLTGSLPGAAAGIPSNLVQAGFGIAAFWLLSTALSRSSAVQKEFPAIQR